MKNQTKLELGAVLLFAVLLLLSKVNVLSGVFHLFYAVILAFYFFPIRLLLNRNKEMSIPNGVSSYVISASICLLSITTFMSSKYDILIGALAVFTLLNLFGTFYYFSKKNNGLAWLHVAAHATLGMYFF